MWNAIQFGLWSYLYVIIKLELPFIVIHTEGVSTANKWHHPGLLRKHVTQRPPFPVNPECALYGRSKHQRHTGCHQEVNSPTFPSDLSLSIPAFSRRFTSHVLSSLFLLKHSHLISVILRHNSSLISRIPTFPVPFLIMSLTLPLNTPLTTPLTTLLTMFNQYTYHP